MPKQRYTGFIRFANSDIEEIDVDAVSVREAHDLIRSELQRDYDNPETAQIIHIKQRFGIYL